MISTCIVVKYSSLSYGCCCGAYVLPGNEWCWAVVNRKINSCYTSSDEPLVPGEGCGCISSCWLHVSFMTIERAGERVELQVPHKIGRRGMLRWRNYFLDVS